jgi:hypothetical protein
VEGSAAGKTHAMVRLARLSGPPDTASGTNRMTAAFLAER